MWHLYSDDACYVFLRETEEERVLVALNNSAEPRALKVPLSDTPANGATGFTLLLGEARAEVFAREARIAMPSKTISIFLLE